MINYNFQAAHFTYSRKQKQVFVFKVRPVAGSWKQLSIDPFSLCGLLRTFSN